jgi:hypothetical protein
MEPVGRVGRRFRSESSNVRLAALPCLGMLVLLASASDKVGSGSASPASGGTIFGSVRTKTGETVRGTIRWGDLRFWDDTLQASEIPRSDDTGKKDEDEGYRFSLFGWTLFDSAESSRVVHRLYVPFGNLRSVEPARGGETMLELKDGSRIPVETDGSDLGPGITLVVTVEGKGDVELPWWRITRVDFEGGPGGAAEAERLFGTVKTRTGELSGFLQWDRDEATVADVLDGSEEGHERKLKFAEIAAIEPASSTKARVFLRTGATMTLGGTNDVNDDNRGTVVWVAGLGRLVVPWNELVRVDFRPAPASPSYERFDGGKRLDAAVRTVDGGSWRGRIRWDQDERFNWETLDGEEGGIEYRIPFLGIRSIARSEHGGADVVLRDGRKLHLTGSNDVDDRAARRLRDRAPLGGSARGRAVLIRC